MIKHQSTIKLMTGGMRIGMALLLVGVASGAAQTSPAQPKNVRKALSQAAQPDPKAPAAAKPAAQQSQVKPPQIKATQAKASQASATQTKTAPLATSDAKKPDVKKPSSPVVAPKVAENSSVPQLRTVAAHPAARRDPFNPLLSADKGVSGPQTPLPAGKPGLVIASLRVDGIVRGPSGMIAIVSNPQMRVYFLRDGDRLYDGTVQHITMEGVSFHETGKDAFGKAVERESTKRLYPTPGEQQ